MLSSFFSEVAQNIEEFSLDVHAVARNFVGEHDWQWTENISELNNDGIVPNTAYERFTEEMMRGTQFYTNDRNLEDRLALGVCAALYCIPYVAGRIIIHEPICNIVEYATWRMTGEAHCAIEPEGRHLNGYIFGAPLSSVVIIPLAVSEAIGRIIGLTDYAAYIIQAGFMRAVNLVHRDYQYSPEKIEVFDKLLAAAPETGWNYLDRIGYVTLPGLIAGTAVVVGAVTGMIARIIEAIGRILGISQYGFNIIRLAHMQVVNTQHRDYTPYTPEEIASMEAALSKESTDIWDTLDHIGYITLPGIIAATELLIGVVTAAIARVGEFLGRILGFTEYAGYIIKAAFMRAANMVHRDYQYSDTDIDNVERALTTWPKTGWNYLDRIGYVTLPGLIAGIEIIVGAVCGLVARVGEVIGRALGFTEYGGDIIQAGFMRAANMIDRKRTFYTTKEIDDVETKLVATPATNWNYLDGLAYLTLPGLIAGIEIMVGAACGLIARVGEAIGRTIGFSNRSFAASAVIFAKCKNMFGVPDSQELLENINTVKTPIKSCWDFFDILGITFSGIASITISIALSPFALLGLSKSNYHRFNYYRHNINNSIKARLGSTIDYTQEDYHKTHLENGETTTLGSFFSRINLINVIAQGIYAAARFIVAPVIYATFRGVKQLFGVIPLVKTIYHACCPIEYDLSDPVDRVRKRFSDFTKSLDIFGRLLPDKENKLDQRKLDLAVKYADDRNLFSRFSFSLFSEGRKIFSLGHTPEERIIAEFKDKVEEVVRVIKRQKNKNININAFFAGGLVEINNLKNGERFAYTEIVAHIKKSFTNREELRKIDRIAYLLWEDLAKEAKENNIIIECENSQSENEQETKPETNSTESSNPLLI
jgi:hypothetical protein